MIETTDVIFKYLYNRETGNSSDHGPGCIFGGPGADI